MTNTKVTNQIANALEEIRCMKYIAIGEIEVMLSNEHDSNWRDGTMKIFTWTQKLKRLRQSYPSNESDA